MKKKTTTFVIHIDEYGQWALYCDGKCMVNPNELILRLSYDPRSGKFDSDITWKQEFVGYGKYIDSEYVEIILHQRDEQNNTETTERLC